MLDVWSQDNSTLALPTDGHLTLLILGLRFKPIHVILGFKKAKRNHHYLMAAHFSISYIDSLTLKSTFAKCYLRGNVKNDEMVPLK